MLGASFVACEQPSPLPLPPPTVKVAEVALSDASRELHLSGTLEAERTIALSFSTIGTVGQVLVQEGEAVTRGQPLARLYPSIYRDTMGMAQAKADQAEDAYRRLLPMHRNKTLPEVKWVEMEAGLQQARLALSIAQKNLADTVLRAPEAGIVARRTAEPGMSATPGLPAFLIVQTKTMLATAPVPETQIARVHRGDPVRVIVAALGKSYEATVRDLGVMADPLTRTYEIKAAIPNPEGELRVGMVVDVRLRVERGAASLVVPPEAVRVDEQGKPCVFVVSDDQRLERRRVEIVGFVGEGTAVSKGVTAGEWVVTSGTPMLSNGLSVRLAGQPSKAD